MKGTILRSCGLLFIALVVGFTYNFFSPSGLNLLAGPPEAPKSDKVQYISLEETKKVFDEGKAVFIDARVWFEYDALHIKGAKNINQDGFMEKVNTVLKDVPTDQLLVVYCSGGSCEASTKLAEKFVKEVGYTNVKVFHDGIAKWVEAGYPTGKTEPKPQTTSGSTTNSESR